MTMTTTCSCGVLAFDAKPCETCANPPRSREGHALERPNKEPLCSDCHTVCAHCHEPCCHDHKDPRKPLCRRCETEVAQANGEARRAHAWGRDA